MINRRSALMLLASGSAVAAAVPAFAKGKHNHANGHNLLGGKLKQNGRHEVGSAGKEKVVAEVSNGKVVAMSAGSLPVKKVRTKQKMAGVEQAGVKLAANGNIQLTQNADYYYGYGFDAGPEEYYYWYPASDVVVTETWIEYVA